MRKTVIIGKRCQQRQMSTVGAVARRLRPRHPERSERRFFDSDLRHPAKTGIGQLPRSASLGRIFTWSLILVASARFARQNRRRTNLLDMVSASLPLGD